MHSPRRQRADLSAAPPQKRPARPVAKALGPSRAKAATVASRNSVWRLRLSPPAHGSSSRAWKVRVGRKFPRVSGAGECGAS
eukprot:5931074-Prymnesium_polylepis.1